MNKEAPNLFPSEPSTPGSMPTKNDADLERVHRLGTLATEINSCAKEWNDKSIELANYLKAARSEFANSKKGEWKTWLAANIKLGQSRVRELLTIADAPHQEEAVLRLREMNNARVKKSRKKHRLYSGSKAQKISDIIERERFIDWGHSAHPDEIRDIWAEIQKRYPVPTKTDELYEIDMYVYVLGTGKLDVLSVARALRVDRSKSIQLLNYATQNEWIEGLPKERWDRHDEPFRPTTLLEFLVKNGGIKDSGGELKNRGLSHVKVKAFGSLVNNKSGMTLDHAREAAVEAGYLHDAGSLTGQPSESTIDDLLDEIDAEVRGEFCFSASDAEEAAEFKVYQSRQNDIERYGAVSFAIGQKYGHEIWEYLNAHEKEPNDYFPGVLLRAQDLIKGSCTVQDAIEQADVELNSPSTDELISSETMAEVLLHWPPIDQPSVVAVSSNVETTATTPGSTA